MQHSNPVVSFCFTTFKRHDHLLATLESIIKQTFTDYEVIVSDNDPEQSGRVVVEGFNNPKFKYYPNPENLGMKKSFNKSLERSTGEYIVMIADDDPVYPDMLATLVKLRHDFPGYGMYLGGCDWFCTHHEVAKLYGLKVGTNSCLSNHHDLNYVEAFKPAQFVENLFTFKIFPHYLWSTGMVKRTILIEQGGVPDYGTPFLGDYAYMSIMGAHSGCVIINKSLGCQTLHDENFGRNQNDQLITAVKNFPEYLTSKMGHMDGWEKLSRHIKKFVGVWIVSHLSFLHKYATDRGESLVKAEKEIFEVDYMRPFKIKYLLKRRLPVLHDQLVKVNQKLRP
ncbi:MAG: glycosyltransferase family A protein [Bacteroidota bacterium]